MEDIYEYLRPKIKVFEKVFEHPIVEVSLKAEGGGELKLGGVRSLPLFSNQPFKPALALRVEETINGYPEPMAREYGEELGDPVKWALKQVDEVHPDALILRFEVKEEGLEKWASQAGRVVKQVSGSCGTPLILDVDGSPILVGRAIQYLSGNMGGRGVLASASLTSDYKLIMESALRNGQVVVAETDCDPTSQRTLNSKLLEAGLPEDQLLMDPTTASLGLGVEYSISIVEQLRLDGLKGDELTRFPIAALRAAPLSWKAREAWMEDPELPPPHVRGALWEAHTATILLLSGADLTAITHPTALEAVREAFKR
jgi:acetyl-CoA decarbonylase/synthase complex subunit delta